MLKIDGTVELHGKVYEWTGEFRPPKTGEHYLWCDGGVATAGSYYPEYQPRFILREVKSPHVYKVGDWVRVIRLSENKGCDAVHPIGAIRQVIGVYGEKVSVPGLYFLQLENIEPCDPPAPKYRPFASAQEFRPHRDKWWRAKAFLDVACPPAAYSETHWNDLTWYDALAMRVFDDGSPCGVLVDE